MDAVIAIAIFVLITLILVVMMAGDGGKGGQGKDDKSKKGASSSRVVTTDDQTPLVPPMGTNSDPPASVGEGQVGHHQSSERSLQSDASGTAVAGGGGSGCAPSGSSPQPKKRGRDEPASGLGLNVPPFHRGAMKGSVPPPPPPPAPAAAAEHEVVVLYKCSMCSRRFTSTRALCGHMRAHPDREWRGAHPPPTFSREEFRDAPGISSGAARQPSKGEEVAEAMPREDTQLPPAVIPPVIGGQASETTSGGGGNGGGGGDEQRIEEKKQPFFDLNKTPSPEPEGDEGSSQI